MPAKDVVQLVIDEFLSKLELQGQVGPSVVGELRRLADEGALAREDAIETALKREPPQDDQAEER